MHSSLNREKAVMLGPLSAHGLQHRTVGDRRGDADKMQEAIWETQLLIMVRRRHGLRAHFNNVIHLAQLTSPPFNHFGIFYTRAKAALSPLTPGRL